MRFITELYSNPRVRLLALTLLCLAILVGLIVLYGRGDYSMHGFVYQDF